MSQKTMWTGFPADKKDDERATQEFLAGGGKIIMLRTPEKNFKDEPKNDGSFIFSREERLSAK